MQKIGIVEAIGIHARAKVSKPKQPMTLKEVFAYIETLIKEPAVEG